LEELRNRASKADEHWDRILRLTAEFDNYKKRAARDRQDAVRFANEGLLRQLIPVIDNFEVALNAVRDTGDPALESFRTGVAMISSQLGAVLRAAGVEEIDAQGAAFDPRWHEAVSQQESAEVPEGQVLQQLRKGYKLNERLLRPASVVVARKPGS
jgi:molecular chaperone GrpE